MKYYSIREDVSAAALVKLDPTVFKVFILIYSQYQFKGDAVPLSYDDIQKKTNLSRGSIATCIKTLVGSRFITRIQGTDKIYKYAIFSNNIENLLEGEDNVS